MSAIRTALLCMAALAAAEAASAQSVTTAFEGFSGRSSEPVKIEADRLEVREKDEAAVFSGNVVVVQGASSLRASRLTIFYLAGATGRARSAQSAGGAAGPPVPTGRDIRRLEADGNVVVASRDQRASGRSGVFDMTANTVTLSGDVTVSQGQNVLKGERLVVDLTNQRSRIEGGVGGGRVQGVFVPGAVPQKSGR